MEAIKKKMQAMKVEKDNACDRYNIISLTRQQSHVFFA